MKFCEALELTLREKKDDGSVWTGTVVPGFGVFHHANGGHFMALLENAMKNEQTLRDSENNKDCM